MKILLIEDDSKIAEFVSTGLFESGYQVDIAPDGETGYDQALKGSYDLIILDLMLPRLDGLTIMKELRQIGIQSKILILSAKHSVDERIQGLQKGGDDYLTKPFVFGELLARCQALLRRSTSGPQITRLDSGEISMNLLTRQAWRSGVEIELQTKEFSLLEYFLKNPETVLSKAQILEQVWSYNFDPQTNVVDVLVCRLRNKLDREFDQKTIHTIRGVGYVFRPN